MSATFRLHNPEAALRFGLKLLEKPKLLAEFPELGRMVPEFQDPLIREIIHRSYRIVYRVVHTTKHIEIARFWHGARGIPDINA